MFRRVAGVERQRAPRLHPWGLAVARPQPPADSTIANMPRTTPEKKTDTARTSPSVPRPDGLTVAWMLTLVTAMVCEFCTVASRAYVRFVRPEAVTMSLLAACRCSPPRSSARCCW